MESPVKKKKKKESSPSRRESKISSLEQAWQLIAVLLIAAAVAALTHKISRWIGEFSLPFCDSNSRYPEDCIPCPDRGICQGGQLECLTGFKRSGRRCVENSLIGKNAEKLAWLMKGYVCSINGRASCDGAGPVWLTENELLDAVKLENTNLHGTNMRLVRQRAMDIALSLLSTKTQGVQVFSCPGHLVNAFKPLSCRFREWCFRNFLTLLLMLPLVLFFTSFVWKYWRYKMRKCRAEELYAEVCEALEAKARGELQSPGVENETWIVAARLRDHLLRPSERKDRLLWLEVEGLVQEDSRIEQYPKMVKGESRAVWEWQVEGSLSPASLRRSRARVPGGSPLGKSPVKKEEPYFTPVKS